MNELINQITNPGLRKYLYRVTWAVLVALVASGKLDQAQLSVALGVAAAVLAVADSQTGPSNEPVAVSTSDAPEWEAPEALVEAEIEPGIEWPASEDTAA